MIKAIVVDDEWYNLEEISGLLDETGVITVAGKYLDPMKALEDVTDVSPQAAFIDIEMPEIDGITLAEKLLEKVPSMIVVFISSWNQYAVQAFDLNALDYIMKPIRMDRFNRMIEKVCNEISLKVPIKSTELTIRCFGSLEASIGGSPVKWERAKAEELFAFLLVHQGRYVHKDMIIENLWPMYEYSKALPILQTSVCKIRAVWFISSRLPRSRSHRNNPDSAYRPTDRPQVLRRCRIRSCSAGKTPCRSSDRCS